MSTTVIPSGCLNNRLNFHDLQRSFMQKIFLANSRNSPNILSACRNLFGAIDHEENMAFCRKELATISDSDNKRWNFDFTADVPLSGRYDWKILTTKSAPRYLTTPIPYKRIPKSVPKITSQSLQSTIQAISTATTTFVPLTKSDNKTTDINIAENSNLTSNTESSYSFSAMNSSHKIEAKQQSLITDFLKTRKRPHSAIINEHGKEVTGAASSIYSKKAKMSVDDSLTTSGTISSESSGTTTSEASGTVSS